jgi:hypothetical protein
MQRRERDAHPTFASRAGPTLAQGDALCLLGTLVHIQERSLVLQSCLKNMDILGVEWITLRFAPGDEGTTLRFAPGVQAAGLQRARRPLSQHRRFAKEVS